MERRILMKCSAPGGAGVCLANTGIGETEQPSEYANPVGTITRVLMFRCHCMAAVVTWIGRG